MAGLCNLHIQSEVTPVILNQGQFGLPGIIGNIWRHFWLFQLRGCWASLIAQLVKNLPAMQETLVQFPGWESPLEKG